MSEGVGIPNFQIDRAAGRAPGTDHATDCTQHSFHYWHLMVVETDPLS